jgi:hypothetical protein
MERHLSRRQHRLVKLFFVGTVLSAFLASCVGGAGPIGPGNGLPQFGAPPGSGNVAPNLPRTQITFQSDQSIILDRAGETYQLRASGSGGERVAYFSRNRSVAPVDANGLITAKSSGVATIIASTRGDAALVTVVIGQAGPNTVAIPSEDVVFATEQRALLVRTAKTYRLQPGKIVISGDRGGLFGRITRMSVKQRNVVLELAQTTIADAFPNMNAHIIGARQHVRLELRHGHATLRYDDGTTFTNSDALKCTGSAGATITGSSFAFDLTATPQTDLITQDGQTKTFDLSLNLDATGSGSTGDLATAAAGKFSCTLSLGQIEIPFEDFLALVFSFKADPSFGFEGSITRSGNLVGPTFSYQYKGPQGIQYDDGNWSQVDSGTPKAKSTMNDQTQAPTGATKLSSKVLLDAEFSIAAKLVGSKGDLVKFTFFDLQPYLGLDFELSAPISYKQEGYTGPIWSSNAGVEALFDLKLDGDIKELLKYLKIGSIDLKVTDWKPSAILLAGSPTILESANAGSGCNVALKATITDDHRYPVDYSGDTVNFETVAGPNAPEDVASGYAQGDATKSVARANWQPNPTPPPAYTLLALLEDPVFSSVGLPYASDSQQVNCASPSPSPSPTPSTPPCASGSGSPQYVTISDPDPDDRLCYKGVDKKHPFDLYTYDPKGVSGSGLDNLTWTFITSTKLTTAYTWDYLGVRAYSYTVNGYSPNAGRNGWYFGCTGSACYYPISNQYVSLGQGIDCGSSSEEAFLQRVIFDPYQTAIAGAVIYSAAGCHEPSADNNPASPVQRIPF